MEKWWLIILTGFLFPLAVLVIGIYWKRSINKGFEGWKKYEALRDQVLKDWQMGQQQQRPLS